METDAGDYRIDSNAPTTSNTAPKQQEPSSSISFGIPPKLEPFILLAKSARGASAANLITQATSAPGVFVFGELLASPSIKELASGEHQKSLQLLEIFSYGVWNDYIANKESLPALNAAQETKLKQLTILSIAASNQNIPYETLLQNLDIDSFRTLESLLIDLFYSDVLSGQLDQKNQVLQVLYCNARDVRPELNSKQDDSAMEVETAVTQAHSVASLHTSLSDWLDTINALLANIDASLAKMKADDVNELKAKTEYEKKVRNMVEMTSKQSDVLTSTGNVGDIKCAYTS